MENWAIIDFSGYYYNNKFIIKELCIFQDQKQPDYKLKKKIMVTKPPGPRPTGQNLKSWINYLQRTGIKWSTGNCSIEELRSTLSSLINRTYIYVKDSGKIIQLLEFLNLKESIRLKNADALGLYERKPTSTRVCSFHMNRQLHNYCAAYNAQKIVDWFFGGDEIICLVVDFNGYFFTAHKFELKEISIFGLNKKGKIVYHNLSVVAFPSKIGIRLDELDDYNQKYYKKFGIVWTSGSHNPPDFEILIRNTLKDASNATHLFVKTEDHKKILRRIDKSKEILCLDNYGYKQNLIPLEKLNSKFTRCYYHTLPDMDINLCADVSANKMVEWIKMKGYFDIKNLSRRTLIGSIMNRELHGGFGFKFNKPLLQFHSNRINDEELEDIKQREERNNMEF